MIYYSFTKLVVENGSSAFVSFSVSRPFDLNYIYKVVIKINSKIRDKYS